MTALLDQEDELLLPLERITVNHLGPTWELNPDWDGVSLVGQHAKYILPEFSLGYQFWAWVRDNFNSPDSTEEHPEPFTPTYEQFRFVIWWYAIDKRGRFLFRRGVLQRLKGHGKDPLAAVISGVELLGPCRFQGWAMEDMPDLGTYPDGSAIIRRGDPVAEENPNAWIQLAAVTKDQTKNTMTLFPGLFNESCRKKAMMRADSIGATKVTAFRGRRFIQAVTSNPRPLEGGRPSLVVKNETEHWLENNNGWEMDQAIDRNAAKSKGGAARVLAICNAPQPSEDSVGLKERKAYLDELAGHAFQTGILYDSLELAADVPIIPPIPGIDEFDYDLQDELVNAWLQECIRRVRGDSWWLDPERIASDILDQKYGGTAVNRRFFFNQTLADEDAWVLPDCVDAAIDPVVGAMRTERVDQFRIGWEVVRSDEPVVMFFDGSKSDDSTALIGCRLSDGYCFTIGIWRAPPRRRRGRHVWLAPRGEVDTRVEEAMDRFKVVAFWADPSHAKDDDDGSAYWDGTIDEWHRRYKDELLTWATKAGADAHSILWDMSSPAHTKQFVQAAERTVIELEHKLPDGTLAPEFSIDGHPWLTQNMKNAKQAPGRYGVGMRKENRESLKKIDAAVSLVGARMLRRFVLNAEEEEEQQGGWARAV